MGTLEKSTGSMLRKCFKHGIPTGMCAIDNVDEKNIKALHSELADTYKELSKNDDEIDLSKKPVMKKITTKCDGKIKKAERLIQKEVELYVKETLNTWKNVLKHSDDDMDDDYSYDDDTKNTKSTDGDDYDDDDDDYDSY